jgi:hypothetical protein
LGWGVNNYKRTCQNPKALTSALLGLGVTKG